MWLFARQVRDMRNDDGVPVEVTSPSNNNRANIAEAGVDMSLTAGLDTYGGASSTLLGQLHSEDSDRVGGCVTDNNNHSVVISPAAAVADEDDDDDDENDDHLMLPDADDVINNTSSASSLRPPPPPQSYFRESIRLMLL